VSDEGVPPEDFFPSDEEMDAWLEEWDEVDREAAAYLREHLAGLDLRAPGPALDEATERLRDDLTRRRREATYLRRANGWKALPDDRDAWLQAVASTISPPEDPGRPAEEQASVMALQHADWLGMVLGLVRRGVGAELDAETVVADVAALDDMEGELDADGLLSVLEGAVEVLAPLWTFLGVLDDERRLTPLGRWGLPVALARTWDPLPMRQPHLEPEVEQAALEILAEAPRSLEELRKALAKRKTIVSVEDLHSDLIAHAEIWHFDDETLGHVPTLLRDVVVTHVLGAGEKQRGMLGVGADLDVWAMLADEGFPLAGGGTVTLRYRDHGYDIPDDELHGLEGPEGWLDDFVEGDVLGLRYVDGELRLEAADPSSYDDDEYAEEVRALVRVIEEAVADDEAYGDPAVPGAAGAEIIYRMRRAHPASLRRPLPPLGVLAEAFGYGLVHGYVARPGAAWGEPTPSWLSDDQAEVWHRWKAATAHWRSAHEAPAEELEALARDLEDHDLLGFVSPEVIADPSLEEFLGAMEDALDGPLLVVPRLLRASVAEARGDMASYRALLEAARDADPDNREALADLADLHAIAGEAREADRLYRQAGLAADTDEIRFLQPFLQPPADGPGRNKPCPCGSGKKYKVCHGRTAVHPLESRANWLWTKLRMFAQRSPQRADILEWGGLVSGAEPDSTEAAREALGNPAVQNFAIVDGGLLTKFLTVMGDLLPADERALAESWEGQPMRLMEVRRVLPMRGVVATDLLTREELEIADRLLSREVEVHDLFLGRPLDDSTGTLRLQSPPTSIPRLMRPRLVELLRGGGTARELAATVFTPIRPTVRTSLGEELVFCTARYDVAELDETWELLADELDDEPDMEALHWLSDDDTVLGTVSRRAGRLVLETSSVERLRALQEILLEVDPEARLVDEAMEPLDLDALADREPADLDAAEGDQPELTPEDFAAIARTYQDRWLDDSIPVLGGETPREAAKSSRRDDLIALLDDFEWQQRRSPSPFDMDVAQLRRELGLDG
jgi:hypothetical protein